ncbi:MAG: hypothetical protein NUW21_04470, partial [Elusimicrobia bacterium]|nr:hypothetical protein [Elusimicrobiota bacterium]
RNPTVLVETPSLFPSKVFTNDLARCETGLLNDWAKETGMYREMRRVLLDGLLGPRMVIKVGYSADIAVDEALVLSERAHAQAEDRAFLANHGRPRVSNMDLHSVHLEQHERAIELAESGDVPVTAAVLERMKYHAEEHRTRAAKLGEQPKEMIRNESIFFKRRSPLRFFYDWEADSASERAWVGEAVVRRVAEVKADGRFNYKARMAVQPTDLSIIGELTNQFDKKTESAGGDAPAERCVLYEIIDLVNRKVITYAHDATEPLRVVDYKLANILPSGPYIDECFLEGPLTDRGVAPPTAYEAHQQAVTVLETLIIVAAKRAIPKLALKGGIMTDEEIDAYENGPPGAIIHLKNMGSQMKISDVLEDMPTPQISAEVFMAADRQRRLIEQHSGLGTPKAAGGDKSQTATESAAREQSSDTLIEDMGSVVEWMGEQAGKYAVRLFRKFYRADRVADIVGEAALEYWPEGGFADKDILNDRGVQIMPGSSRRNNSAIQMKSLTEVYGILAQDPMIPAELKVDVLARLLDAAGVFGIDLDSVKKQMIMLQLQQIQGGGADAGGAAGPDQGEGGNAAVKDRAARRGEAPSDGDQAGRSQGAANVGGGRVQTGASRGDKPRG